MYLSVKLSVCEAEVNAMGSTADDEAATKWQVAHESILVSYGCKTHTHTHSNTPETAQGEHTRKHGEVVTR